MRGRGKSEKRGQGKSHEKEEKEDEEVLGAIRGMYWV